MDPKSMFGRRPAQGNGPNRKMPNDACDPNAAPPEPETEMLNDKKNAADLTSQFNLPADFTKADAKDLLAKLKGDEVEAAGLPAWLTPLLPLVKQFLIELLDQYLGG